MTTAIEWVKNLDGTKGETWNPVTGCTKVSEGCDHCYAERITNRFGGPGAFDTMVLHPERLDAPLRRRKPTTWFVNSMSDMFHDDVPDEFVARVFAVMGYAGRHTFQVLTKRPGRMASLVGSTRFLDLVAGAGEDIEENEDIMHDRQVEWQLEPWPLRNVWLGTSVENQKWADVRIPKLLETPAAVRFLSCEPLLGPVSLDAAIGGRLDALRGDRRANGEIIAGGVGIDWVIAGGESGPGARPMHPDWARSLRDQCVGAGVPFFFKQWGEWTPANDLGNPVDPDMRERVAETFSDGDYFARVGKKRAGRELDGRTWDEMPERAT